MSCPKSGSQASQRAWQKEIEMLIFHLANLSLTLICQQFVYNKLCCHIESTSARIKKHGFIVLQPGGQKCGLLESGDTSWDINSSAYKQVTINKVSNISELQFLHL